MKHCRNASLVGIVGLISAGLLAAGCSSSSSNGTGKGGSGGGAGAGGAGGHGGAGGAGGGAGQGGSSGDAGAQACNGHTAVVPTSPLITDFSGDAAASTVAGAYTFAAPSLTAPTTTTTAAGLVATINTGVPGASGDTYAGFGLPFNSCTDGSAYSGVKFHIGGTLSAACSIQFSAIFSEDATAATTAPFATCTAASCYPPAAIFTLPAAPADVTVMFSTVTGGAPISAMVIKSELNGIQWQVNVPTSPDAGGCTGMVTITNISFVP
jgi:hypothetical protein